jgi:hypothetical protein
MPKIEPIVAKLNRARAGLENAARAVPANRWKEPPRPGAWSAAEVIAHLTMVEQRIDAGVSKVLANEPQPVPIRKRFHVPVVFAEWRGFRVKSPIPLDPSLLAERESMLTRLEAVRRDTLALLEQNRGRDMRAYRFPHPFFGSLNLYDWFKVVAHHEVRHTKQIREIVEIFQR